MNWNVLFLLTVGLNAPAPEIEIPSITAPAVIFDNYARGYKAAGQLNKPMLVILNPATEAASKSSIPIQDLRHDEQISSLLDSFVVVVVDTGSKHGKQVHQSFGSKPLPYLAVIDEHQKKQVFQTSHKVSKTQLAKLLETYQHGTNTQQAKLMTNCILCQRKLFGL